MKDIDKELNIRWAKKNETIREHTDKLKREAKRIYDCGYITSEIYDLLVIACEYHDYGKLNPAFQDRIHCGGIRYSEQREIPHNVLSFFFLDETQFKSEKDYLIVATAVTYHHDYSEKLIDVLRNPDEEQKAQKLLEEFSHVTNFDTTYNRRMQRKMVAMTKSGDAKLILIKGLLHRCDYSASAEITGEIQNDFLTHKLDKLMCRWKMKSVEASWNSLQLFCEKNTDKNIMVTAPTGMGKTEAGLKWIGNNKGVFILPLRTAINAMYSRIKNEIIGEHDIDSKLGLLHGETQAYYAEHSSENGMENISEYYDRTKQLTLPLTVCTLDQIFDFVFKYPGYEYKLATLSYCKVVIDEVQMYTPELLAYLVCGLEQIHRLGGKIAILTATLPPFAKREIQKALSYDVVEEDFSKESEIIRHNIKVIQEEMDAEIIFNVYQGRHKEGKSNKILVICNSVETSQAMYDALSQYNIPINLLHARFTQQDRKKKEKEILEFGKTYVFADSKEVDCQEGIWIATSVVEASLDIDFDVLFTELWELFSLFQRLGRCNRKGMKSISDVNCYVFTEIIGNIRKYVDESIYQLSKEALCEVDGVITETQKSELIETYLSVENMENCKTNYVQEYYKKKKELQSLFTYDMKKCETVLREVDSKLVIPKSVYEDKKNYTDINKAIELSMDNNCSYIERVNAKHTIMKHSVGLRKWEYETLKNEQKIVGINKNENYAFIPIADCEYSYEKGLELKKKTSEGTELKKDEKRSEKKQKKGVFI